MKQILLTTIAAVLLVGCGESQQSAPAPEAKPVEPVAGAIQPEQPTAEAPDISIWDAVLDGDIEAVKQHIAAGTDVNAMYEDGGFVLGMTPLHIAAFENHKEIVELLIANGADVNVKGENGETPLDVAFLYEETETADPLRKHGGKHGTIHGAARGGDIEAVKEFLAAGTDVNAKDEDGHTPLYPAAFQDDKEIAELLIAKGADVHAKDGDGLTPLHFAAVGGSKEIAELLIASGAGVNVKSVDGQTALDIATDPVNPNNPLETADLLRKHGGKHGTIHGAARGGDIEAVKEFLAAGADVNAKNAIDETPLDLAAMNGYKETAELLIAKGANVNAKNKRGDTSLNWAIRFKKPETAALIRKNGGKRGEELRAEARKETASAKPEASTLLRAIEKRDLELAKKLIEGGADIEERGRRSATPLYFAAYNVDPAMTKLLLENGANVHASDYEGEIPLHTAVYHSFSNVEEEGIKVIEMLIEHGTEVNRIKQFPQKFTPLDFAKSSNGKIADLLRKHGGMTAQELRYGITPLHAAAVKGNKEIAEQLIANGADVNAKDPRGTTPLLYAAASGHKEIAELLIAKGADVNAKVASGPKQGLTPLDAANETNHTETADLLRKHGGKTRKELKAEGK